MTKHTLVMVEVTDQLGHVEAEPLVVTRHVDGSLQLDVDGLSIRLLDDQLREALAEATERRDAA